MSHYFLGIPLPTEVKAHLHQLSGKMRDTFHYGYWTGQADYHITLLFLGAVVPDTLEELKNQLHHTTSMMSSIHLTLNGLGSFGKKDQPRVLWMGVKADQHLYDLQSMVKESVVHCGLDVESRPYRPHITIAKKWRGQNRMTSSDWEQSIPEFQPYSWLANQFHLFQVNPQETPRYQPIETFTLT